MPILALPFGSIIDVPTARILARDDAGTGPAEALTNTEIFAILGTGTPSASTYLRGDGTWSTVSAGVGGSTGSVDNAVLRADGTGGTTLQASGVSIDDLANVSTTGYLQVGSATPAVRYEQNGISNVNSGVRYPVIAFTGGNVIQAINIVGFAYQCLQIERTGGGANTWLTVNYNASATGAAGGRPRQALDVRGNAIIDGNLQCHKGTTPVLAQIYNTYTSDTSFERLTISWANNVCYIGTEKGSAGGTARDLTIGTDGAVRAVFPAATTSGAFYLGSRADNTVTGGNARGSSAVDFQTIRTEAAGVASGLRSFIGNGYGNKSTGEHSSVLNGNRNTASGTNATVLNGDFNTATAYNASVLAGCRATASRSGQATVGFGGSPYGGQNLSDSGQYFSLVLSCRTIDAETRFLSDGTIAPGLFSEPSI